MDLRDGGASLDDSGLRATARRLRELPCPSLALGRPASPSPLAELSYHFDAVFDDEATADQAIATLEQAPLAGLALVQLLRHNEAVDVHAGLVAESFAYSTLQAGPEFAAWRAARREEAAQAVASSHDLPAVQTLRTGQRLDLVLNHPERHNAFSLRMRDALAEALILAHLDSEITEIRLCARGRHFCAGGDLSEFGSLVDPATAHAVRSTRNVGRLLAACPQRVEARLHGGCVGAGIEIPAFATRVVANPDAFFLLPELELGLVPGAGGTVSLTRRIGRQRTAFMALTRQRIDAETALGWGLIDAIDPEVVPQS